MKKNKTSFETSFWAGYEAKNPFKVINAFFDFAHLDDYKQNLNEAVLYCYKTKVYKQDNPSDVFILYTVVRSLLKACYCLQEKSKKWKIKESLHSETAFELTSLTKEEYNNPFSVFQKAFNEKTLEEFDFFLCQVLELSLSPHPGDPDPDFATPYMHLIKMLDATELLRERGVEKIKKSKLIDAVME
ncbi:hypothetical protein [Flavobacterium poyangense]|uniref:hypothetical protein n=1 Tax=Flavobacterium poyangense TaxID=2204302 RepID=UPI001421B72E|nr:hypothetical protein [Flavobacterium sp. JXAS1]